MPVVSTLANVSLSLKHKKKGVMESGTCCKCRCSCHEQPYLSLQQQQQEQSVPMHAWWGQSTLIDVSNWTQKLSKKNCPLFNDVQRTPFRAFNGKAYAVPLNMTNQFNAALQYAQNGITPHAWGSSNFSLHVPGVLWRHDPYSAKVLGLQSDSLACKQGPVTVAQQNECGAAFPGGCYEESESEAVPTKNGDVDLAEEQMMVKMPNEVIKENGYYQPTVYNSSAWNPMCVLQPSSAMLGTVLCFSAAAGTCSSDVYSDISLQQSYASQLLTHHQRHYHQYNNQQELSTTVAATADNTTDQRQDSQVSAMPIVPSARPFPFVAGRRVVVRSVQPPSSQGQQRPSIINSSSTAPPTSNTTAVTYATTGCGQESLTAVSQSNSLVFGTQNLRCTNNGGGERGVDESPETLLATLSLFRSLPPLFTDLVAHTNRRPSTAGRPACNDNQLRTDDVRYVYLVEHRCRRTVCAAPVLHEIGAMVVLEGDMGIEMGAVRAVLPLEDFDKLDVAGLARHGFPTDHSVVTAALILRTATAEETQHYTQTLCHLAKDLLDFLRHRINPSNFMDCHVENMEFLDCEFQADGKKIYVYYRAKKRVLFRELAQYLHSFYRCRIWLHEVGKCASTLSSDSLRDVEVL